MNRQLSERPAETLTAREREILQFLAEGKSNRQVADALVLSVHTIKWYNRQIYGKLGVANRHEAVTRARALGLLPSRSKQRPRHNLPAALSTFIGRMEELNQLRRLLASHRLVTLTGAGGIGKTRLALEEARAVLDSWPDGVWLVELAYVSDPSVVLETIITVLQLQAASGDALLKALENYLHEKEVLLVLDNCEQVIDACARLLERLLRECSQVRFLVTSREVLNIDGEAVLRVPPLSLPDAGDLSLEMLSRSEAVALFLERAAVVLPGFVLSGDNAAAVAHVCRSLDGIPLAIELAASKVSVLKVQQIAERLEDALRLLSGGRRTALPRHQTLRATIAWSYRLLSRAEQTLLRRLSVFSGSWTLEAAEVICTGRGIEQGDILALHVQLVDKSLVVLERQPGKVARYRWLDTIRQYTLEKLFEEGEAEVAFNFHCEWFLALSERAAVELMGPEQIQWLNRLEAERDNLRAALRWSTAREDPARALRLAASLADYWLMHAYFEEGIRWLQAALDLDVAGDRKAAPESRARALLGLTLLVIQPYGLGPFSIPLEELLEYCREALSIYRILNDDRGVVHAKYMLGRLTNLGGDTRSARAILGEALSMAQQNEDRWGSAKSLCALAYVAWLEGDMRAAKRLNEESLALEDRAGDVWYFATSLLRLAEIALRQGDILRAKELYEEALLRLQGTRMEHEIARIQRHLAVIQTLRLRFEEARSLLQAAQSFADRVGDQKALAFTKTYAGNLAYQQGDLIEARSQHEESLRLFQKLGDQYNVGWALANIGAVVCRRGDLPRAELLLKEGLALVEEGGDPADLTSTLQHVAHLMRMQGRYDQAIALDRRCLMEFDVVSLWPNSVEGLGQCAVALGQLERAVQLFGAGQRMREQLGTPVPPIALADHERSFSLAQKGLSAEAFSSAWKAGQEMTIQSLQAFAHSGDWPALFR